MELIELESFNKFIEAVDSFEDSTDVGDDYVSPRIFRGHCDCAWKLETTLERYSDKEFSLSNYLRILDRCMPEIEVYTGKSWGKRLSAGTIVKDIQALHELPNFVEFMIYMRHHGFPSQLIDWTGSPYIAAYFAYSKAITKNPVSIYVYHEFSEGSKSGLAAEATIKGLNPSIACDKRHHSQQAQYTICTQKIDDQSVICSHDKAFSRNDAHQDILIKYTLPSEERDSVLKRLNSMNITSYTLFHDEDGLANSLAFRHISKGDL